MTVQGIAQFVAFPFIFLAIPAQADVNVTNNPQSYQTECSISADPTNPQHIVISGHPGGGSHLNVYFTTDGGATWDSTHIDARMDGHTASTQRGDPSVAFATTGDTVYVAYLSRVTPTVLRTYCVRSIDGGQSFTASALVASGGANMDKPFVATGPNTNGSGHNVYLAYDNGGLILSRSTNPSTFTFSHSSPLSGSSFPAFAVPSSGADGVVCVTYRGSGEGGISESIRMAYSDDEGATFSTGYSIAKTYVVNGSTTIPAAPAFVSSVPSIGIDRNSGRTYVAFVTASYLTADLDIAVTYSDDPSDPASWSTPRIVHKSSRNSQFHPWLAIDQSTGKVGIVYYDGRNDSNNEAVETWVAASQDGGGTWYDYPLSAQASDATGSATGNYYREYIGATAVQDTLMAVWSHYPTIGYSSEFYFDRAAFGVIVSPDTIYVPDQVANVADAIEQAQAGDVVLVSGSPADQPILGAFEPSTWVKVAPEPGTGTPVLDANGASRLVTFPTRYTGEGLVGFRLEGATLALVSADVDASLIGTAIVISSCELVGGDYGVLLSRELTPGSGDVQIKVADSSFEDQEIAGIAGSGFTCTVKTSTFAGCVSGIDLSSPTSANIDSCEITASTAYGILLTGVPGEVRNSTSSPASGVALGVHDLNTSSVEIDECTLEGGEVGCELTNAIASIDSCRIAGQSSIGVQILDANLSAALHNRISWCHILEEGSAASEPKYGVYLEGAINDVNITSQLMESNTIVGWDTGIRLTEIEVGCIDPCPEGLIGCLPICIEPFSPLVLIDPGLIIELTRNMVVGAREFGIDYDGLNYVTLGCNNAWIPGTVANSYRPTTVPSGNSRQPPLFCESRDDFVAEWTLRIDSPGAPGNSPCGELIGALPVECAWDTLARSTTVASGTTFRVLEDVIVPIGKSLILEDGVTAHFDTLDNSERGLDQDKNELTVLGTLEVNGTSGSRVTFDSTEESPTENQHWWGFYVPNSGIANMDFAAVNSSDWGFVFSSEATSVVENSTFSDNNLTDIKSGSASPYLTIRRNTLTVGGGIGMDIALADSVVRNTVNGDANTTVGIFYSSSNDSTATGIARNELAGISTGTGIELGPGSSVLASNTIDEGVVGIKVTGGTHQVGTTDSDSDNIIDGASIALQVIRGGPSCPASGLLDLVVKNNQFLNYTDGLVTVKAPKNSIAPVDAGISVSGSNQGLNQFINNDPPDVGETFRAIVAATSACDSLYARANFFGQYAGSIEGEVDTTGTLTTQPASASFGTEPVPINAPSVRMLGAYPNPTSGHIRFDLAVSGNRLDVEIQVLDVLGRLVRRITATGLASGVNHVEWDGTDQKASKVSNGIYFVRVRHADDVVATTRIVMAR